MGFQFNFDRDIKFRGWYFLFFFFFFFGNRFTLRSFLMRSSFFLFRRERSLTTYLRDNRTDLWTKMGSGAKCWQLYRSRNSLSLSARGKQRFGRFIHSLSVSLIINKFVSLCATRLIRDARPCRYRALNGIFACNMRAKASLNSQLSSPAV